jgi:hypothetical protein
MTAIDIAGLIAGFCIVIVVLFDVFTSVVVPRPVRSVFRLSAWFSRTVWPLWRGYALRLSQPQRREQLLGMFGPSAMMALLALWEIGLIVGFGLIFFGVRREIHPVPGSLPNTIYFAGSS